MSKMPRLISQNVRRSLKTLLLASLGIVLGIAAFSFFLALREGVRVRVLNAIFPIDRLEVVPGITQTEKPKLELKLVRGPDGKPKFVPDPKAPKTPPPKQVRHVIDDAVLARLSAMPEVGEIVPKQRVEVPIKAILDIDMLKFFGVDPFPLDMPMEGVPAEAMRDEPFAAEFQELSDDPAVRAEQLKKPVPVVISRFAIEMYDGTFAPVLGLPDFDKLMDKLGGLDVVLSMLNIPIVIGDGVIRMPLPGPHEESRMQVIGTSSKAMKLGASVPMSYAKRWNARLGPAATGRYSSVIVIARHKSDIGRISAFVQDKLGLMVDNGDADRFAFILDVVSALLVVVAFIIMVTAAINIGHVFFLLVAERRREIGVLRAVGASRSDITRMVLGEAAVVGLFGGILGVGSAMLVSLACDWAAASHLPNFPFKPDSFFLFRWWIVVGGVVLAVAFCILGAFFPARRAARMDPASALAKG